MSNIRNVIVICPVPNKSCPVYNELPIGQLFRYLIPWCEENIYIKTNNSDTCVHLNTGMIYTIAYNRQVAPLKPEEQIMICSPKVV